MLYNYVYDCKYNSAIFFCLFFLCDAQLEKRVDGLFDSFARLDSRISSVGQTAAKIGDHLQVKCYATPNDLIFVYNLLFDDCFKIIF